MRRITQSELDTYLDQHAQWATTQVGPPFVLRDMDARGLSLVDRNLVCLQMVNVNLNEANLAHTVLARVDLQHVQLRQANLAHADLDVAYLKNVDAHQACFDDASLSSTICRDGHFHHARMQRANLIKASFLACVLDHAVLTDTRCNRLTIGRSSLRATHLQRAYMSFVSVYDSDLRGANLADVQLIKPKIFENLAVWGLHVSGLQLEGGRFNGWYDASPDADQSQLHDGVWMQQVLRGEIDV